MVSKPAVSLKKSWGGYRRTTRGCILNRSRLLLVLQHVHTELDPSIRLPQTKLKVTGPINDPATLCLKRMTVNQGYCRAGGGARKGLILCCWFWSTRASVCCVYNYASSKLLNGFMAMIYVPPSINSINARLFGVWCRPFRVGGLAPAGCIPLRVLQICSSTSNIANCVLQALRIQYYE